MNNLKAMYRTRNILASTISEIVVQADPQRALFSGIFRLHFGRQKTVISRFA
jgi:hypothetical protein